FADGQVTRRDAAVLCCLAGVIAWQRAGELPPRPFFDYFSAAFRPVVPHDLFAIAFLGDIRRSFSVFATHGAPAFLPETDRHTTDLQPPQRFPVADSPLARYSTATCSAPRTY